MSNALSEYARILGNRNVASFFLIIIGFVASINYLEMGQEKSYGFFIILISALCISVGLFGVFKDVIASNRGGALKDSDDVEEYDTAGWAEVVLKLEALEKKASLRAIEINFQNDSGQAIREDVRAIFTDAAREAVDNEVENRLSEARSSEKSRRDAVMQLRRARYRLIEEIKKATKRATNNMVIGSAISTIGIIVIGVTAFTIEIQGGDIFHQLTQYAPRLLLGVFIQLFAFFFLRLYRRGFDEIRYLQNEATNVDSMGAALICSMASGDKETLKAVVEKLSSVERNFIIEKGQTTIELRREEIGRESDKTFLEFAKEMLARNNGK
ncbi:hypothetical protein ACW7BJ_33145 [Azospirillum argentinense]